MRKVSDHMRLVKREAGANPARTRHRDSQATAYYHWETGKGVEASERSVGRPAFRSTGMKSYRSPATFAKPASSTLSAASQLIFAYKKVRVNCNEKMFFLPYKKGCLLAAFRGACYNITINERRKYRNLWVPKRRNCKSHDFIRSNCKKL